MRRGLGLLPADLPSLKAQAVAVLEKRYATEDRPQAIAQSRTIRTIPMSMPPAQEINV